MDLKDYTTEELNAELKRRKSEAARKAVEERKKLGRYVYAKAVITKVVPAPFSRQYWRGQILDANVLKIDYWHKEREFRIIRENFNRKTAPRVGDIVLLKSMKTNLSPNGFAPYSFPRISKVLERKNPLPPDENGVTAIKFTGLYLPYDQD